MAEVHPGTDIEIPSWVPTSPFRNAIPNPKRYMKVNDKSVEDVYKAAHEGDWDLLEELLSTGDEKNLFNGDVNAFVSNLTPLQAAAMAGQTETVELLLQAKADPHMKERMAYGKDPEDGRTALDLAKGFGYMDTADLLEAAEKDYPFGWYVPEGPENNAKQYGGYEWGKKPTKGWYMCRPGAARRNGLDPKKYGDVEEIEEADAAPAFQLPSEPPLPLGLLFPGQGSQYVKMLAGVKEIPAVKDMLAKAKSILGYDVLELCLSGPEEKLQETKFCQPAMFIAGLAGMEKLRAEKEEAVTRPQLVAGLSLGEYTALCAAGVFTFEDALELVKVRAEAMDDAAKVGSQAMLSVAGIEKAKLEELCAEAVKSAGSGSICQIANELFPKGFSCGGTEKAVMTLKEKAEAAGALQAKVLKTSGGFHTPLMKPAVDILGKKLDAMLPKMKPPRCSVYMNATAKPVKPGQSPKVIVEQLKLQLTNPVLWEPSVRSMIKDGVSDFYEVGPMKQLKAMMKRIDAKAWATTTNVDV